MRGYLAYVADKCSPCLATQEQMIPLGRQTPEHPGFVALDLPYDCAQCIRAHGTQFGFPELDPENQQAWALYFRFQDQQRAGFDLIGLDYGILPLAFDLYDVPPEERRITFEKIALMNREVNHRRAAHRAEEARQREWQAQQARGVERVDVMGR